MPNIQNLLNNNDPFMSEADREKYLLGLETQNPSGGVDYDYYRNLFGGMIEKGNPNLAQYRQNLYGNINASTNVQQTKLKEMLAGTGMLRSGSATSAALGLESGRANALANAEVQLSQNDTDYQNQAIGKLLGLEQMGLQEQQSNRSYAMGIRNLVDRWKEREFQQRMQEAQEPDTFGSIFGSLLGTFGGNYLGGLGQKLAGR